MTGRAPSSRPNRARSLRCSTTLRAVLGPYRAQVTVLGSVTGPARDRGGAAPAPPRPRARDSAGTMPARGRALGRCRTRDRRARTAAPWRRQGQSTPLRDLSARRLAAAAGAEQSRVAFHACAVVLHRSRRMPRVCRYDGREIGAGMPPTSCRAPTCAAQRTRSCGHPRLIAAARPLLGGDLLDVALCEPAPRGGPHSAGPEGPAYGPAPGSVTADAAS